ncbi:MAG: HAMP domain-containing protein [Spirochaetaceae bacterium]|nr:HAMP domain-containing protein [Spirochaetaceae bacterium]
MSIATRNHPSQTQKRASLRHQFIAQSSVIIFMMLVLVCMIVMVRITINDILENQEKANVCQLLANEVRQSSEDLTNACRMYIVSGGDTIHSNEYKDIVGWRSGTAPRPTNLSDELFPGETISLIDLLERSGFIKEELDVVETALILSDNLAKTELQAMESVRVGHIVDGPQRAIPGETVQDFAIRIVTSDSYNSVSRQVLHPLDVLIADIAKRMTEEAHQMDRKMFLYQTIMFVAAMLVMVLILIFVVFLRNSLLNPILQTSQALSVVSSGDLTAKLEVQSTNEVGQMFADFNSTMEYLRHLIYTIQESIQALSASGENLAQNMMQTASAMHQMEGTISTVTDESMTQAGSVMETTETVAKIIETIKRVGDSVAAQASSVTESSASVEEMLANISSISTTLEKSDEVIRELSSATTSGRETVSHATTVTHRINEASGSLMEASGIIQHIASQTNMLAMNAAIEAAHAGEAGQGFAVVADEIRKLAEESSTQGKAITSTLKHLSGDISSLDQATRTVEEKFNAIYGLSERIMQMSTEMTLAMHEQNSGSQEVLSAIKDINTVTLEVREGSDEMLQGSEAVVAEMARLNQLTNDITASMHEMANGASQINGAVQRVSDLTVANKESIQKLSEEIQVFKV